MDVIMDLIGPALFGAGTGGIGLIVSGIAKGFSWYAERKNKEDEHRRVIELTKLNADIRDKEFENEREIEGDRTAASLRQASYEHDSNAGKASQWVIDILRLTRVVLTVGSQAILAAIYFWKASETSQMEIEAAFVYMATSSFVWWFGDRMTAKKK